METDAARDMRDWVDKAAIQELVVRYSDAATRGAWDEFEALWTEDAVWEVGPPIDTRIVGARAIRDDVNASVDREDFLVQMTHGAVVTLLGDGRARGTTTIHALARRSGDHDITNYGVYYDEFAKVDGTWMFSRRRLQPVYADTSAHTGAAPITRAALGEL